MKRILLTGGTGLVGAYRVDRLLASGVKIRVPYRINVDRYGNELNVDYRHAMEKK